MAGLPITSRWGPCKACAVGAFGSNPIKFTIFKHNSPANGRAVVLFSVPKEGEHVEANFNMLSAYEDRVLIPIDKALDIFRSMFLHQ